MKMPNNVQFTFVYPPLPLLRFFLFPLSVCSTHNLALFDFQQMCVDVDINSRTHLPNLYRYIRSGWFHSETLSLFSSKAEKESVTSKGRNGFELLSFFLYVSFHLIHKLYTLYTWANILACNTMYNSKEGYIETIRLGSFVKKEAFIHINTHRLNKGVKVNSVYGISKGGKVHLLTSSSYLDLYLISISIYIMIS